MEQRTCPVCGEQHERRGIYCSRRCFKRVDNARRRGTEVKLGPIGQPFDCAQCDTRCEPGVNVASHASKFCGAACKVEYHDRHQDGYDSRAQHSAAVSRLLGIASEPTPLDVAAYRRALRRDPCAYCGAAAEASDHIVPKSNGGPDDWTNRTGACHGCNGSKMQTPLLTFLAWKRARDEFEPWRQVVAAIHTR